MGDIGLMVMLRGGRCSPMEFGWLDASGLLASRRRADGFLCALSVLRSGRFAFAHGTVGFLIQRSAPSGAVAGRFMKLRGAYSRSGGGMKRVLPAKVEEGLQCAVGLILGSGVAGNEGSAGQRQLARAPGMVAQTERSGEQRL